MRLGDRDQALRQFEWDAAVACGAMAALALALGRGLLLLLDELRGALRQGQIAQLVQDDELGAGVAANDPGELAS